jgi:hypothetical protein
MLKMTKYTGTKTIKACPMPLGEAEKVLGRTIETSAVENRELTPGYLVEYQDGYRSWSPKEVFDKAYRVSETHLDRMNIEKDEVEARYLADRKFSFTQQFRNLSETKRKLLTKQLDMMECYLYTLSRRIELESEPEPTDK